MLVDYGSDSDSDAETTRPPSSTHAGQSKGATSTSLPASSPSAPKTKRGPKKIIAIENPSSTKRLGSESATVNDGPPPAKKPRTRTGAGSSSLLSMLPAPKTTTAALPAPQRVLGGGSKPGLIFNTGASSTAPLPDSNEATSASLPFVPVSVKRGKANVSLDDGVTSVKSKPSAPTIDFFSLGSTSSTTTAGPSKSTESTMPIPTGLSAAPVVADFTPPEPSQADPHPGYYQLPTGTWAQHDPEYYAKFQRKWQREYDDYVRRLEKGMEKGFEGGEAEDVQKVDAAEEMDRAKQEIEERKAQTGKSSGEPAQPNMKISAAKMSKLSRTRHQLSTLLSDAYSNREALEERIAQAKRNKKEAGSRYGF